MKKYKLLILMLIIIPCLFCIGCGVLDVSGKTFRYKSVSIDWGLAEEADKNALFAEYQVSNETELKNTLKTLNNRNSRLTTFGTDNKYTTKNTKNEILDTGYYKQDESIITLAETEEGLSEEGAFTLQATDKGYTVTVKLNDDKKIFAKYHYTEQE